MKGFSEHPARPQKDESPEERVDPSRKDESLEERPNPFVRKEHQPGLRLALLAALASGGVAIGSESPTKAAPASKDPDVYRQSISKEEMKTLEERKRVINARNIGSGDTYLQKKHRNLTMQMDNVDHAARKKMEERTSEIANEVGRYLKNERQLGDVWYSMSDSLAKGAIKYRGLESTKDTEAYDLLVSILKIQNQVHMTYPKVEDFTRSFVQNPDVQTAGRIKDVNERMQEFFSLPKEAQDHALAETVREINARDAETTPAYVPPSII